MLRLSPGTPMALPPIYTVERMDNRIWQSCEDAYAVDSGVSNPMVQPDVGLTANTTNASAGAVYFQASAAVFGMASLGQIIRMGGGIATVTSYISPTIVVGQWSLPASDGAPGIPYAAAGNWTISEVVTQLVAPHLANQTLVGLADGVPISDVIVSPIGIAPLPFPASDVKLGLGFTCQLQTPYLNSQGVAQGARKVIPAASFRLASSATGFQVGTNQPDGAAQNPPQLGPEWTDLATGDLLAPTGGQSAPLTYTTPGGAAAIQTWTGDIRVVGAGAAWESKGQVAIQQTLPVALEVTAIMPEVLPGDTPEVTYQQGGQNGPGGRQEPRPPGMWALKAGSPRL